jgi:cephalosporin hydroxylase
MPVPIFERLVWDEHQIRIDDIVLHLQPADRPMTSPPRVDGRNFVIHKNRGTMAQYVQFWAEHPTFDPRRVFEVGIWAGGSVVLWNELLRPERLVAVDLERRSAIGRESAANLDEYLRIRPEQVRLFWETDQADAPRLRDIVRRDLDDRLDLVIDDASHFYGPTKRSFETLFPLVRPGGWYVIEDWRWDFNPSFRAPDHPWATEPPLSPLVLELMELLASGSELVRRIIASSGVVFLERGPAEIPEPFRIEDWNARPPMPGWAARHELRRFLSPRRLWWDLNAAARRRRRKQAARS